MNTFSRPIMFLFFTHIFCFSAQAQYCSIGLSDESAKDVGRRALAALRAVWEDQNSEEIRYCSSRTKAEAHAYILQRLRDLSGKPLTKNKPRSKTAPVVAEAAAAGDAGDDPELAAIERKSSKKKKKKRPASIAVMGYHEEEKASSSDEEGSVTVKAGQPAQAQCAILARELSNRMEKKLAKIAQGFDYNALGTLKLGGPFNDLPAMGPPYHMTLCYGQGFDKNSKHKTCESIGEREGKKGSLARHYEALFLANQTPIISDAIGKWERFIVLTLKLAEDEEEEEDEAKAKAKAKNPINPERVAWPLHITLFKIEGLPENFVDAVLAATQRAFRDPITISPVRVSCTHE